MVVPVSPARRYPEGMEQEQSATRGQGRELLARAGIVVTDEGVARAKEQLDEVQRGTDWDALRARFGLASKTA